MLKMVCVEISSYRGVAVERNCHRRSASADVRTTRRGGNPRRLKKQMTDEKQFKH